jgi:hypothetical protein
MTCSGSSALSTGCVLAVAEGPGTRESGSA